MRILSIEVEGFGPFKQAQSVDFSAFDDFGIFLIAGSTGAGKSMILDAICFALYGSVPRYDGYSGAARLRSDHCEIDDPTRVTLTFEVDGRQYRLARSPDYARPKKVGTGVTEQKATVELSTLTESGWEGLDTKASEVSDRLAAIVKLNKKQFLQVILLAQNRFQEFLEAQSEDRQGLLRTLFGTQRFEDYVGLLHARAQALGDELKRVSADGARTVHQLAEALELERPTEDQDSLAWARRCMAASVEALRAARQAERQATDEANAARVALNAAQLLADRQKRRGDAATRLEQLEARAEAHERDRARLQMARRAAEVAPLIQAADLAAAALLTAQREQAAACEAAGAVPESDLSELIAQLIGTIGSLARAVEAETKRPELEQAAGRHSAALAAQDQISASIDDRRLALRERLSELEDLAGAAGVTAKDLSAAQAQIESITAAHAAAVEAAALDAEVERLEQLELAALSERTAATADDERLRAHRLQGSAAVLAEALAAGEPCPVCGALEHPHPARFDTARVTDAQLAAARARLERARAGVDTAARRLAEAEVRAAQRRGAAGGHGVETLDRELQVARARLQAAQAAQAELESLARQRAEVAREQLELDQRERAGAARRTKLAQDAALSKRALSDAEALIELSREGHESVAARVAAMRHRRIQVERLNAAGSALASALAEERLTRAALRTTLDQCGFPDRGAAAAVTLPDAVREQLDGAIAAHDQDLIRVAAVLSQEDLQGLPDEPANVPAAAERAALTDRARSVCTERRATLEDRDKRARQLAAQLADELQKSQDLQRQHLVLEGLAGTVRGDARHNSLGIPLESFVLAAELEEIVAAANQRLRTMSQGRYSIEHSDERTRGGKRTGLEIVVYDAHTGAARSPRSLSGGEKFLASLALALGLAEVVTNRSGGIQLDTLFIDEGFGSLDNETLEIAMQTLDQLRQGGRTVGLISHVEAMKEQIPAKLLVEVAGGGWSVIRQDA